MSDALVQRLKQQLRPIFLTPGPTTILEQLTTPDPNGTPDLPGLGEGPENRFDQDGRVIIFTPTASGGYDIEVTPP